MQDITVVGIVIGIFGMATKSLFDWLKQRSLQDSDKRMKALEVGQAEIKKLILEHEHAHRESDSLIEDLHDWHDRRDADGVPVWYVRKSLEDFIKQNAEAVTSLAQSSAMQTQLMRDLAETQKEMFLEMKAAHSLSEKISEKLSEKIAEIKQ